MRLCAAITFNLRRTKQVDQAELAAAVKEALAALELAPLTPHEVIDAPFAHRIRGGRIRRSAHRAATFEAIRHALVRPWSASHSQSQVATSQRRLRAVLG
jgi:hypothetical protein